MQPRRTTVGQHSIDINHVIKLFHFQIDSREMNACIHPKPGAPMFLGELFINTETEMAQMSSN